MTQLADAAVALPPGTAMRDYASKGTDDAKVAYRDEVIFTYIAAIDARYSNFIASISSQKKYGNSLLGAGGLYASTLASVATGDLSRAFAATSSFYQGAQGELNNRLFYEQTLPALISQMDAQRLTVRSSILQKLNADRVSTGITYSMAEAFMDLARYEEAASIDKAVAELTQSAATERQDAEQKLDQAQQTSATLDRIATDLRQRGLTP